MWQELIKKYPNNITIKLNHTVTNIDYNDNNIIISYKDPNDRTMQCASDYLGYTGSISLLQQSSVSHIINDKINNNGVIFTPPLPAKIKLCYHQVGAGQEIKIIIRLDSKAHKFIPDQMYFNLIRNNWTDVKIINLEYSKARDRRKNKKYVL